MKALRFTEKKIREAVELRKKGMSILGISRKLDVPYGTVYWHMRFTNPENTFKNSNVSRLKCRKCMFRGIGVTNCEFILCTGHSRPCSVEDCCVYVKGKRYKGAELSLEEVYEMVNKNVKHESAGE